jgi:hypothetical protein
MDLSPSAGVYQASHAPLPDVTVVFASVAGAAGFTFKRNRSDTRFLNKIIRRCMLQQLSVLPGGDGYLCRVRWLGLIVRKQLVTVDIGFDDVLTNICH